MFFVFWLLVVFPYNSNSNSIPVIDSVDMRYLLPEDEIISPFLLLRVAQTNHRLKATSTSFGEMQDVKQKLRIVMTSKGNRKAIESVDDMLHSLNSTRQACDIAFYFVQQHDGGMAMHIFKHMTIPSVFDVSVADLEFCNIVKVWALALCNRYHGSIPRTGNPISRALINSMKDEARWRAKKAVSWSYEQRLLVTSWGIPALSLYKERPLIFWTKNDGMPWIHFNMPDILNCPVRCAWVRHIPHPDLADVVVFDCLQQPGKEDKKHRYQLWLLLCMESAAHLPKLKDDNFLSQYDISATYRRDSDVPVLYTPGNGKLFAQPLEPKSGTVVWIASNCAPGRLALVQQLDYLISIDSYGKCLNNKVFPALALKYGSEKVPLISKYKFVLSFENSFEEDYVTEKLYHPFIAGSVPIYFGAPNVHDFLPSRKSIVNAAEFRTLEELAEYIKYLDRNDTAYMEYHAWRNQPHLPSFKQNMAMAFNTGEYYGERDMRQNPCRLCHHASNMLTKRIS